MFLNKVTNLREGYLKELGFKSHQQPITGVHNVIFTIASGTILNVSSIENIGFMQEDLFIDYVDIEWCIRANSRGFKVLINADTIIEHSIGESTISFLGNIYPDRSPIRMYFLIRNGINLSLYSKTLSFNQKSVIFIKTILYIYCYSSRGGEKINKIKCCLKGFYHGLINKMGNPL